MAGEDTARIMRGLDKRIVELTPHIIDYRDPTTWPPLTDDWIVTYFKLGSSDKVAHHIEHASSTHKALSEGVSNTFAWLLIPKVKPPF